MSMWKNVILLISTCVWGYIRYSLIMGRGLQKGKITGPKLFAPPSQDSKTFCGPPFKERKLFAPLPSLWLKLQATVYKLTQNFL